jgi:hypothetical protein
MKCIYLSKEEEERTGSNNTFRNWMQFLSAITQERSTRGRQKEELKYFYQSTKAFRTGRANDRVQSLMHCTRVIISTCMDAKKLSGISLSFTYHWYSSSSPSGFGQSRDFSFFPPFRHEKNNFALICGARLSLSRSLATWKFIQSFVKRVSQEATGIPISRWAFSPCSSSLDANQIDDISRCLLINNHLAQNVHEKLENFFFWDDFCPRSASWSHLESWWLFIAKITVVILI